MTTLSENITIISCLYHNLNGPYIPAQSDNTQDNTPPGMNFVRIPVTLKLTPPTPGTNFGSVFSRKQSRAGGYTQPKSGGFGKVSSRSVQRCIIARRVALSLPPLLSKPGWRFVRPRGCVSYLACCAVVSYHAACAPHGPFP